MYVRLVRLGTNPFKWHAFELEKVWRNESGDDPGFKGLTRPQGPKGMVMNDVAFFRKEMSWLVVSSKNTVKDLDLWHIILNDDFLPVARNKNTQVLEVVPFEQQYDDFKRKLAKNNKAKMVLYNALPKKAYDRIFICKTAKDIWQSLLITHQGNSQVKDNKIDLLVQQYEQVTILEEESIDSGFARFNTIITSLKALDEGFSSKNYVKTFLRALHPKWRAIDNLKVHEVVMEKDFKIYRGKKERIKSIALNAKKESGDDETSTSGSDAKNMLWPDEKKGNSDQKCFRCGDPNHLIGDCPKPPRNKDQKAFIGEEAIENNTKVVNNNSVEDESKEVDEVVNVKESKNHPLEQVIGNLNQKTLRSQAQNHSNFFCFISTIEPKNVNEALRDESWVIAMQEELNQFIANDVWDLVPLPKSHTVIGTNWVYKNKLDKNGIVSRNKARLVAQGYKQQEGIDYNETYASIARLEPIRILLAIAWENDFKLYQMDVKSAFLNGFINKEVYVAQPSRFIDFEKLNYVYKLKKAWYGLKQALEAWLEDSKPTKMPVSTEFKLTKDDEANSVDSNKYRGKILILTTLVYADSDHVGDYVDRKSTSGVCTFMGCCLTFWFFKKQTTLAISTTEAEYVSAKKACQQALWMKQALIDYDKRLDEFSIMYDNKGAIDLNRNPIQHSITKNIEIRYYFLRDNVQKGNVSIEKVASEDNTAGVLTKPLKREVLNYLRLVLGMMELIMDSDPPSSKK
nr:retrovirus-related Pol polyprotein from transposon TNT 1-94 [Tanacetum cinerariifolium]